MLSSPTWIPLKQYWHIRSCGAYIPTVFTFGGDCLLPKCWCCHKASSSYIERTGQTWVGYNIGDLLSCEFLVLDAACLLGGGFFSSAGGAPVLCCKILLKVEIGSVRKNQPCSFVQHKPGNLCLSTLAISHLYSALTHFQSRACIPWCLPFK